METIRLIRDLYNHMEWADAEVWRAVLAAPPAAADWVVRDRLHHIHMVQRAFLGVWLGAPVDPRNETFPDMPALAWWGREYHGQAAAYLENLDAASLDAPVQLPWAGQIAGTIGREIEMPTLGETLVQVASHSTYHRGQANARLRETGGEPPLVDYIPWVWFGRPRAAWPG